MIEKTMRYPGTIEYLRVLRDCGYFDYDPVEINGQMIRPIDLTSRLLFPKWKLLPGEEDITVMRITVEGKENNVYKKYTYDLFDTFDIKSNTLSMARTTGYTCCAVANLILNGKFSQKGLCPPEFVGINSENFEFIFDYLRKRNVIYKIKEEKM